ncbi:MAG: alpha/beta hydrolase [Burkholderiales bacterium]|nr:alpha/beta hydrolase [Burkholderiales bacterium]
MPRFVPRILALIAAGLALADPSARAADSPAGAPVSVVLVHGAFADGSDWARVIPLLQARGVRVTAVQNPLTSLADDVAATKRAIDAAPGKVVLVGHSWGGTVITQAGAGDKVAGLVYVSAFAPDVGQSSGALGKGYPTPPGLAALSADASGFLRISDEGMRTHFAFDVPPARAAVMAATQGPIAARAFDEPVTVAAWKTRPSWFVVATRDHMISPELQLAMAQRIGARVTTLATSHVSQEVEPDKVAAVILDAVAQAR